jgi:hypothetical protein
MLFTNSNDLPGYCEEGRGRILDNIRNCVIESKKKINKK